MSYEELDSGVQEAVKNYVSTKRKLDDHKAAAKDIKSNEKTYKAKIESTLRKKAKHDSVVVPYEKVKVKMELVKGKPKPVNKKYIQTFLSKHLKDTNINPKELVKEMFSAENRGRKEDGYRVYIEEPE